MPDDRPGNGLWGWLGRQIGHVKKAVKTDVVPKQVVIHREQKVQEAPMPGAPDVKLRRTVTDEVIVQKKLPEK